MGKEICISTTPHETRLAILEDDQLTEVYYERENEYTLAGSVYKGRVTRVLPGMQSSFVDLGLERDAFLYVTDFLEDSEDQDEYETSSPASSRGRTERPADPEEAVVSTEEKVERPGRKEGRRDGRRNEGRRPERTEQPIVVAEATETLRKPKAQERQEERAAVMAALKTAEPAASDRAEKGDLGDGEDGSPEGTRRWRGRRGRRRGGMRAGVLGTNVAAASPEDVQPATAPFDLPEHGAPGGMAAPVGVSLTAPETEPESEGLDLQAAAAPQREQRVKRERNREDRPARSQRNGERMDAPVATGAPADIAAPVASAKAAFLPGESLSKYGVSAPVSAVPRTEAKLTPILRPVNYTPPRPTSQVDVPVGWDGGSMLPGESISRYKSVPAAAVSPASIESDPVAAEESSVHFAAASEPVTQLPGEPFVAAAPDASIPEISEETVLPEMAVEALPGLEHPEQLTTSAHPLDVPAQELQTIHAVEEASNTGDVIPDHEEGNEYEPKDGEASVRMSPPATSELRFSQLFGLGGNSDTEKPSRVPAEPASHAAEPIVAVTEHDTERVNSALESEPHGDSLNTREPGRSTMEAGMETGSEAPHAVDHGTREHSPRMEKPPIPPQADAPAAITDAELHAHTGSAMEQGFVESMHAHDNFSELVDQLQGFAPGAGFLEEEVMDEEEYDFDPIHAHLDDQDLEDLEEETLDGDSVMHDGEVKPVEVGTGQRAISVAPHEEQAPASHETYGASEHEEEDSSALAFEVIGEDEEDEAQPAAANGDSQRSGEDRARTGSRTGGRTGGRGRKMPGGGGGRRQSAQTQDLPIISDLLKQGQEILVQIAKEPIAKKGARITSHIALPGRFLVFMPTVSHVGVSRKIASDEERQRLKRILISEKGDFSGGFIVRTAAEGASEEELRADLRFLINLWSEIKQRAEAAKAPALIYHDLNLVERILRDQVSSNFSAIWVDTEQEYERIVRFLNRFQPALVRRVKLYTKETPLFEHFGIQEEISKALKAKVWLKSGGSIVINQTEALVAIDINTGKYVGKTARLEDTIVKTNLDAIPEIVRQIRLRDLGGIIIIDFIDMDERKNRNRVLAALEEAMKVDRAPSKVLQFNDFGLIAITRKRVKQSLERTLSVTCEVCVGTGMVKSPITVCNEIFIELRKMHKHLDGKDVMLRVHPEVVKQLKSANGRWINEYEEMVGKTIIIKSDSALHPEQFDIH